MNSFVVKAIILSAIVAYYGQCEGGSHYIAAPNGGREWGSTATELCTEDGNNIASQRSPAASRQKKHIAVSCCKNGGGLPQCSGQKKKTYAQAVQVCSRRNMQLCTKNQMSNGMMIDTTSGGMCESRYNWVSDECGTIESGVPSEPVRPGHLAQSNSRDSHAAAMSVATTNGAKGSGFDVVSAMIGFAVGAVLMLLTVYVVNVVRRKRKIAKSDEEAMVSEQTEDEVQETPANVVTVETVIETEME